MVLLNFLREFGFSFFIMSRPTIPSWWLIQTREKLESRELNYLIACKRVPYEDEMKCEFRSISKNTLKAAYTNANLTPPNVKPGPAPDDITPENLQYVLQKFQEYKCGIQKMFWRLNMDQNVYSVSYNKLRRIYSILEIKEPKSDMPPQKYYTPYEATKPDTIWHVDVHFLYGSQRLPVYGIIDDKSRFLLALKILPNKSSESTTRVAEETIGLYQKPFCFWSDNGGENMGQFYNWLMRNNIQIRHTLPHMPRQNGKIERLWPSLERNVGRSSNAKQIQEFLDKFRKNYNSVPHKTLPKKGFRPMTPEECYNETPHWKQGETPFWRVMIDGHFEIKEIPNH